ncbi:hypothetical protein [Sorangium sp. So ce381]
MTRPVQSRSPPRARAPALLANAVVSVNVVVVVVVVVVVNVVVDVVVNG